MWPSQICVGDLALTKDDQQDLGQIGRNFISRCAQQRKQEVWAVFCKTENQRKADDAKKEKRNLAKEFGIIPSVICVKKLQILFIF